MATLGVIRYSDGRTIYPCGSRACPPTNPKAGSPSGGNTVIWSERTRATTLKTPRVEFSSNSRTSLGKITYQKPPSCSPPPAASRSVPSSCPAPTLPKCGK